LIFFELTKVNGILVNDFGEALQVTVFPLAQSYLIFGESRKMLSLEQF